MSTNKNSNTTKANVEDVFKSIKFVDALMNEAAKTETPKAIKESFESSLKAKLLEGDVKETVVDENRYTDKQNNNYPTYNYDEATPGTPEAAPIDAAPEAGLPTDAAPEMGADAGLPTDTTGSPEMGGEGLPTDTTGSPEMGSEELPTDTTGGGGMSMGGGAPAPDAGAPVDGAPTADAGSDIESPEDIEALVDQLIDKDIEQTTAESMGNEENTNENNSIEETVMKNTTQTIDQLIAEMKESSAGAETLTSTVAKAANVDQTKSQGDAKTANIGAKYEKLGAEDFAGKVADKGTAKTEAGSFDKIGAAKKIDQSKGQGDAENANLGADYKDLGADDLETKMKKEAVLKSKALFVLAEKYLHLEDENKALKFESYKSLKANGILALAPELSEATKIGLIKKFDECKSYKATQALYEDVIKLIKNEKKADISEATGKDTSVKVLKEEASASKKEVITEAQKRIMFLSGAKGHNDQYFNGNEI